MNILILIMKLLGLAAFGNLIAEKATPIQALKQKLRLSEVELFNCPTCITFHLSWIYFVVTDFKVSMDFVLDTILISSLASFISHQLWRLWNKF